MNTRSSVRQLSLPLMAGILLGSASACSQSNSNSDSKTSSDISQGTLSTQGGDELHEGGIPAPSPIPVADSSPQQTDIVTEEIMDVQISDIQFHNSARDLMNRLHTESTHKTKAGFNWDVERAMLGEGLMRQQQWNQAPLNRELDTPPVIEPNPIRIDPSFLAPELGPSGTE